MTWNLALSAALLGAAALAGTLGTASRHLESPAAEVPAACRLITHDCELCSSGADGQAVCSSVGIACVPTRKWCLE